MTLFTRNPARKAALGTLAAFGTLVALPDAASAIPPRADRVTARIAERAYARQSIAEARAARAEARVAEIAPLVPVPPPPRPVTVRRMARAGVPLPGPAPVVVSAPLMVHPAAPVVVAAQPAATPRSVDATMAPAPIATVSPPPSVPSAPADVADDGTRSVLTTAAEPAPAPPHRGPAGGPVTHPPIELLPTPQPQ